METGKDRQYGLVAILDALGASNFGKTEIDTFIESRAKVLRLLDEKVEHIDGAKDTVSVFTFNDTILIVMRIAADRTDFFIGICAFFVILRKFFIDSLMHKIMFRGSVSIGTLYVNDDTNTVMGPAVTDAAAWYDKADWIGIHATPKASLMIQRHFEMDYIRELKRNRTSMITDYDVPMKNGATVKVSAVNWPIAFLRPSMTPCKDGQRPREKILELLTAHAMPPGTESKYNSTLSFFDHCIAESKKADEKAAPPAENAP